MSHWFLSLSLPLKPASLPWVFSIFFLSLFLSILLFKMFLLSSWHAPTQHTIISTLEWFSSSSPLPSNAFKINDNDIHNNNKQLSADAQPEHRVLFPRDIAGAFPRPTILVVEWLSHREAGGRAWVVLGKAPTRSTLLPVLLTKRCLMQSNALWLVRFTWLVCSVPITIWFPKKTLKFSLWKRKKMEI